MKLMLIAVVCLSFLTCSSDSITKEQYNAKINEIEQLKIEIRKLKSEIDELKHGAARELAVAKNAVEKKYWDAAIAHAQNVIDSHPETPEAKEAVSVLEMAKEAKKNAQVEAEREIAKAMSSMIKKYDKMREITVWNSPPMPMYVNVKSWVGAYIMEPQKGLPYLRFTIYYVASDWLFIDKYLFDIDGEKIAVNPPDFGDDSVTTDNSDGIVWETYDVLAEGNSLAILKALSEAKSATIRYEGKNYYRDREIGQPERNAIRNTLKAFEVLTKKKNKG